MVCVLLGQRTLSGIGQVEHKVLLSFLFVNDQFCVTEISFRTSLIMKLNKQE